MQAELLCTMSKQTNQAVLMTQFIPEGCLHCQTAAGLWGLSSL